MSVEGSAATSIAASLETSEESQEEDGFSRKFAALSRKEREFRTQQTQWDQDKAELEEYRSSKQAEALAAQEAEANKPEVKSLEHRLRRNPLETLNELGLDYERRCRNSL